MDKFEYKIINRKVEGKGIYNSELSYGELEQSLNELGIQGWEVVSIAENDCKYIGVIFLKRKKIDKKEDSLFL
jgi:hypothetical protein